MFVYAFHFLLAIIICIFVIIAFARFVCSRAIYVFLRVSYFVFHFILSSVVCLYPSEMFKDLSARFSKIYCGLLPELSHREYGLSHLELHKNFDVFTAVGFVKRFLFSLRILLSMKFGFKKVVKQSTNKA